MMLRSLALFVALCAFWAAPLPAEVVVVEPEVASRVMYDDNIYMRKDRDLVVKVSPGLDLEVRNELLKLKAQAETDVFRYSKHSRYDHENYRLELDVSYHLTERFSLDFSGDTKWNDAFEAYLEETGLARDFVDRFTARAEPGLDFSLTEIDSLRLAGSFLRTDYDKETLTDSTSWGGNGSWTHHWSERLRFFIYGSFRTTDFSSRFREGAQRVYQGMAGFEYDLSETASIGLRGGPSWIEIEYDLVYGGSERRSEPGWAGSANVRWSPTELLSLEGGFERSASLSMDGDNLVTNSVWAWLRYDLAHDLWFEMNAQYRFTTRQTEDRDLDNGYLELKPSLNYKLDPKTTLKLCWARDEIYNLTKDKQASRDLFFISLTIGLPVTIE